MAETAQIQNTASLAATGAKVGSIVPGVGTVIGAVVGAVAGWVMGKKPVRPSSQDVLQCKSLLQEYMGIAAQTPAAPIPMELEQIRQLHWCLHAVYGAEVKLRDPRFFLAGFDAHMAMNKKIVLAVYETKVGAVVKIDGITWKDPKGRTIQGPAFEFINKPFVSIRELTERTTRELAIAECAPWGGAACGPYWMRDVASRLLYDTLAYVARTQLPNISEEDLRAASSVAAQVGTSAKDVVTAVEQIIGRNVQRGETAQILPPAQAPPAPTSTTPDVTVPVPADAVPEGVAPPAVSAPALPPNATQADVTTAVREVMQQFMSTPQAQQMTQQQAVNAGTAAAQQWLAAQGMRAPASEVEETAKQAVQAGLGGNVPLLVGAGLLMFALARPAPRARRRRSR